MDLNDISEGGIENEDNRDVNWNNSYNPLVFWTSKGVFWDIVLNRDSLYISQSRVSSEEEDKKGIYLKITREEHKVDIFIDKSRDHNHKDKKEKIHSKDKHLFLFIDTFKGDDYKIVVLFLC